MTDSVTIETMFTDPRLNTIFQTLDDDVEVSLSLLLSSLALVLATCDADIEDVKESLGPLKGNAEKYIEFVGGLEEDE